MSSAIIFASLVTESSRAPLKVFRSIPSERWTEELQRFFDQIKSQTSCFSGKGLFIVSRKMIPKLGGIISVYVLVLLQFDLKDDGSEDFSISCEVS